jgi:trimethylamine---corrinoid protein Co-methyltransferase
VYWDKCISSNQVDNSSVRFNVFTASQCAWKGAIHISDRGRPTPTLLILILVERRKVTKTDVCNVATLVDALPSLDFCMSLACISDVTPVLADVHEVKAMLENTIKPIVTWAFNRENNAAIVELCEAAAGGAAALRDNPSFVLYTEPATPLKHPKESLDKLLYMAQKELPVIYTPGRAGQRHRTASLAGVIVMAASDCFAGLVIHQLKNEGAPFIAGGVTTNMDMSTTIHCYASSPDFCLMHAGYSELVQYLRTAHVQHRRLQRLQSA